MFRKETTSWLSSTSSESVDSIASQSSFFQQSARPWTSSNMSPNLPVTDVELADAIFDVLGCNCMVLVGIDEVVVD